MEMYCFYLLLNAFETNMKGGSNEIAINCLGFLSNGALMKKKYLAKLCWLVLLGAHYALGEGLSIEDAIGMALVHAPEIKIAQSELSAQKSKHVSAWLELGPRLSGTFNGALHDSVQSLKLGEKEIIVRDDFTKTGSLMLTQPLTGLFALTQNARVEGKQKSLKDLNLKLIMSQVAFKVAELYLNVQQSIKMLEVAEASLEATMAQRKDGELLLNAGRIHQGDFLKLDLAVSQAQSAKARAQADKEIVFLSLLEMIGSKNIDLDLSSFSSSFESSDGPLPVLDDCLVIALNNRMEKIQAEKGEEIASLARAASMVKFLPNINFFAQIDRNFGTVGMGGKEMTKMLGLNLTWEFWNNGAHLFQVRESFENYNKAHFQKDAVVQKIKIDLIQALSTLKAARQSYVFAQKAVEQSLESYRIERLKFQAGKSSATELVLAEAAKTNAHAHSVAVFTELKVREFKLQQALGKNRPEL